MDITYTETYTLYMFVKMARVVAAEYLHDVTH